MITTGKPKRKILGCLTILNAMAVLLPDVRSQLMNCRTIQSSWTRCTSNWVVLSWNGTAIIPENPKHGCKLNLSQISGFLVLQRLYRSGVKGTYWGRKKTGTTHGGAGCWEDRNWVSLRYFWEMYRRKSWAPLCIILASNHCPHHFYQWRKEKTLLIARLKQKQSVRSLCHDGRLWEALLETMLTLA